MEKTTLPGTKPGPGPGPKPDSSRQQFTELTENPVMFNFDSTQRIDFRQLIIFCETIHCEFLFIKLAKCTRFPPLIQFVHKGEE